MTIDCSAIHKLALNHGAICRVVIVETKGSTPRDVGTDMMVWQSGQRGTIGGGTLEFEAQSQARRMLTIGTRRALVKQPLGPNLGQCCGGVVTLMFEVFDTKSVATLAAENGFSYRPLSDAAQDHPPEELKNWLAVSGSFGVMCDNWFGEPAVFEPLPVWIYGAGHVGSALALVLAPLPNLQVTLIDTAPDRLPNTLPDGVIPAIAANPASMVQHAPDNAIHLAMTYSHSFDFDICNAVLSRVFGELGVIGSATKLGRFNSRLRKLGHSDGSISRIICPIGEPGLGKHPQEIAIGVARYLLTAQNTTSSLREIAS